MVDALTIATGDWAREATANGTPRLHRLLMHAIESADLSATDVYSLGDWIAPLEGATADHLGLLLVGLFLAAGEGSLALELAPEPLRKRLEDLAPAPELEPWIAQALAAAFAGRFEHVIGDGRQHGGVDRRPLLLWRAGERRYLYFQKHLRAEEDLSGRLRERAARPNRKPDPGRVATSLRDVLERTPLRAQGTAVRWDQDQLTAFGLVLLRDLVIISGGPGTGKTSVILTLLRCLVRLGVAADRIALAAPTGRAAQRLTDSLRIGLESLGDMPEADRPLRERSAVTVHTLLEYHPGRGLYRRHEENPVPADVVLVDEVSMVSVEQMASLLRAIEEGTQLILLGDKDQLPSVDAGAMLAQLVPQHGAPAFSDAVRKAIETWLPGVGTLAAGGEHWLPDAVVMLRTNHRSEQGIRATARAINEQRATALEALPRFVDASAAGWTTAEQQGGCWWWDQPAATAQEMRGQIHAWAEHVYDGVLAEGGTFFDLVHERTLDDLEAAADRAWLDRLFRALERTRLLTLVRQGAWGCEPINETMQAWLRRRVGSNREWLPGTPILITQNDKRRGLYNGDVGLTLAGSGGAALVIFARHGGYVALAPALLPRHELGFALTVHKSQGSEFQQALIVLPPTGARRLLTKELLYTAITRAKKLAIVSSTVEAFQAAVGRRIVRESGMTPSD